MKKGLILLLPFLLAPGWIQGQFQINPLENFWSDPVWRDRFAGSYGALTSGEPAMSEGDKQYFDEFVKPLLPLDVAGAADKLESHAKKAESGPAVKYTLANFLGIRDGQNTL